MRRFRFAIAAAMVCAAGLGIHPSVHGQQTARPQENVTVFDGARLIIGDSSPTIERGALVVQGRQITAIGPSGQVRIPAGATRVDLTGKTLIPAIVDTHSHLGYFDEVTNKEEVDHFTRERVLDHLDRFAYTGHALTYSLGSDTPDFIDARYSDDPKHFVDLRDESERDTFTGRAISPSGADWPGRDWQPAKHHLLLCREPMGGEERRSRAGSPEGHAREAVGRRPLGLQGSAERRPVVLQA